MNENDQHCDKSHNFWLYQCSEGINCIYLSNLKLFPTHWFLTAYNAAKFFNVVTRLRCNSNSIYKLPLASIALRKCEPIKNIHTRTHIVHQQENKKKIHRKVTDEPSKRAKKKWRHYFVIKNGAWCIVSGVHFFCGYFYLLNVTCGRQNFHIDAVCVLCSKQNSINYFTALLYETGREKEKKATSINHLFSRFISGQIVATLLVAPFKCHRK